MTLSVMMLAMTEVTCIRNFDRIEELKRAALAWAQEHGYEGDELPQGVRGEPDMCPLARATGMEILGELCIGEGFVGPLPELVQEFIAEFDRGSIPELEDPAFEDPEDEGGEYLL